MKTFTHRFIQHNFVVQPSMSHKAISWTAWWGVHSLNMGVRICLFALRVSYPLNMSA